MGEITVNSIVLDEYKAKYVVREIASNKQCICRPLDTNGQLSFGTYWFRLDYLQNTGELWSN